MILGHVIALDPTVKQAAAMARAAGVARFAYNWGLAEWNRQYRSGGKPTAMKLKAQFNAIKGEQFPWVYESPKDANQEAFSDLGTAYSNFFKSLRGERKGRRMGRPRFKKKRDGGSFYVSNDKFRLHDDGKRVYLPVIGSVKTHEKLRLHGRVLGARVSRVAGRWHISVQVDGEFRVPNTPEHAIVGVDLGLKTAVMPSHGEPFLAPKPLKAALKQLRRANRRLHRREKGGANRNKARQKVARTHLRIRNVRHDFLHKTTTRLVRENQAVVIEDLNVQGMLKNRKLARALSDVGLGLCRVLIEQKGPRYGCEVIVADRWFPSSKRCSGCGNVKDSLLLSERVYECAACGLIIDRDRNAALNLEAYPGLLGNERRAQARGGTPTDTRASTRRAKGRRASVVAEVGTKS